ncbi:hypothetical protein Drorol1_Dr00021722 [Drosera rotundifolia]
MNENLEKQNEGFTSVGDDGGDDCGGGGWVAMTMTPKEKRRAGGEEEGRRRTTRSQKAIAFRGRCYLEGMIWAVHTFSSKGQKG